MLDHPRRGLRIVNGIRWARSSNRLLQAAVTVDIDHIPGPVIQNLLEPALPAEQLREDAQVLAAHGLSLYSDPQAVTRYRKLAAIDTKRDCSTTRPSSPPRSNSHRMGRFSRARHWSLASAAQDLQAVRVDFVLNGGGITQRVLVAKKTVLGWTATGTRPPCQTASTSWVALSSADWEW